MFQQMLNGSIAVLTRPSASTFEEHEQNNLGWALIYSLIAGVINAIISWIDALVFPQQIVDLPGIEPGMVAAQPVSFGSIFVSLIGTVIGLLLYWGFVYLLGRAFGGTGAFGELAYGFALFSAPLAVLGTLVSIIPFVFVGVIISFGVSIYSLYLTYLAIQSGMNLPANKALYVVLILLGIVVALVLCIAIFFATVIAAFLNASGGFAP
ncbi:MAG: Yip1 family protein [Chloroflexaceae bacterium]